LGLKTVILTEAKKETSIYAITMRAQAHLNTEEVAEQEEGLAEVLSRILG